MSEGERERIAQVLREHWRTPTSGCYCGGVKLGQDWALHVADAILTQSSGRPR